MIQSGVVEYGVSVTPGWNLSTGTGERIFLSPDIKFSLPFSAPPHVVLALNSLDSDHATNLRVVLEPYDVEADEFNIKIRTWDDTVLSSVSVTWIAHD